MLSGEGFRCRKGWLILSYPFSRALASNRLFHPVVALPPENARHVGQQVIEGSAQDAHRGAYVGAGDATGRRDDNGASRFRSSWDQ